MNAPLSKLGLGSGQFALDQLPAAGRGRGRDVEARDILSIAARAGLGVFELTGHSAQAETIVGGIMPRPVPFRVVLSTVRPDRGPDVVEAELRAQLRRLGLERCDAILAPTATDLFGPQGLALWDRLKYLRDQGLCRRIGMSVYASDDPVGLARRFRPDIVQAPASLLDQRLLVDGSLAELAAMGVEVHLRSIFLNGLLFLPPDRAPSHLKSAASRISRARRLIAEGRSDPLQAALGFALSRPEASAVLVGVSSAAEMSAVVAAAMRPPPDLDWDDMALDDPAALDRGQWAAA
ncbi:bifunctional regulator KidO [Phenylobacterium sp.]|uniref:bifunctional regulator KidO n=1 Tax=Phenylobacterium sp. TaxID=1871053 RepID=UPI002734872D|nr:bifunctional regulator KidO [Phenylobacterium sp.]MDP3174046.1 bifunctional regulator KidO [Phenylobacterium sp.]MDP3659902.1 bifunctional regulator KidO [Phenylobacterium sp.]